MRRGACRASRQATDRNETDAGTEFGAVSIDAHTRRQAAGPARVKNFLRHGHPLLSLSLRPSSALGRVRASQIVRRGASVGARTRCCTGAKLPWATVDPARRRLVIQSHRDGRRPAAPPLPSPYFYPIPLYRGLSPSTAFNLASVTA